MTYGWKEGMAACDFVSSGVGSMLLATSSLAARIVRADTSLSGIICVSGCCILSFSNHACLTQCFSADSNHKDYYLSFAASESLIVRLARLRVPGRLTASHLST